MTTGKLQQVTLGNVSRFNMKTLTIYINRIDSRNQPHRKKRPDFTPLDLDNNIYGAMEQVDFEV
jgi:hypothetical protein